MRMNAVVRADSAPSWVAFALDGLRLALPLASVSRIVHAASITPLPDAPDAVAGALDVAGTVMAVYDLRRRLRLPPRPMRLEDQIIIAQTSRRALALIVDRALGVVDGMPAQNDEVSGVLTTPDGLVLIPDLETFLSPADDAALESALRIAEVRCKQTR